MEKAFLYAKELVTEKYGDHYDYYPMLTLAVSAILFQHPEERKEITDLFLSLNLYIEEKTTDEIMYSHQLGDETESYKDINNQRQYGFSDNGIRIMIDENNEIHPEVNAPYIVLSSLDVSKEALLNSFAHEFLHLLNSVKKPFLIQQMEDHLIAIVERSGYNHQVSFVNFEDDSMSYDQKYDILDEVINVFQTTELMEIVLSLGDIVCDSNIKEYFHSLNPDKMKLDYGYNESVNAFRPLWEIPSLQRLLKENVLLGEIDVVMKGVDYILGYGSFDNIADYLEEIDYLETYSPQEDEISKRKEFLKEYALLYQTKEKIYQ